MPPRIKRNAGKSQNQLFNEKADRDAAAARATSARMNTRAIATEDISTPPPSRPDLPTRASSQTQPYAIPPTDRPDLPTMPSSQTPSSATPQDDPLSIGDLDPTLEEGTGQFGESQPSIYGGTYDAYGSQSQDPASYALEEDEEETSGVMDDTIGESQIDSSQKRVQRAKFMWDKERVLELKALKMYSDFICLNRHRGRGLRANEKSAIVAAVIKAAREMYPGQADRLSLVFSQVKTKFDWYQRKTTAIERLLKVSG